MYQGNITIITDFGSQDGLITGQCIVFASNERVKEVIGDHTNYPIAVKRLVEAGIQVVPVTSSIGIDAFNWILMEPEDYADIVYSSDIAELIKEADEALENE